jgi:hypothetical protein
LSLPLIREGQQLNIKPVPRKQPTLTRISDAATLCTYLGDAEFRVYCVLKALRGKYSTTYVTVNELCALVPSSHDDVSSASKIRRALKYLSGTGLISEPDGSAVTTSSRPESHDQTMKIVVRDLPLAGSNVSVWEEVRRLRRIRGGE